MGSLARGWVFPPSDVASGLRRSIEARFWLRLQSHWDQKTPPMMRWEACRRNRSGGSAMFWQCDERRGTSSNGQLYFGGNLEGEEGDRMTVYEPCFLDSRSPCSSHLPYMRFTGVHSLWFVPQAVISTAIRVRWQWDCCTRECIV